MLRTWIIGQQLTPFMYTSGIDELVKQAQKSTSTINQTAPNPSHVTLSGITGGCSTFLAWRLTRLD
ncbi:MAG: hypothetical protein ACKVKV_00705, partial [Dehalococcoidia bacterium]